MLLSTLTNGSADDLVLDLCSAAMRAGAALAFAVAAVFIDAVGLRRSIRSESVCIAARAKGQKRDPKTFKPKSETEPFVCSDNKSKSLMFLQLRGLFS